MTELIIPAEAPDLNELKERRIDIQARRAIFALLKRLVRGQITLVENSQRYRFGEESDPSALQAVITIFSIMLQIFFLQLIEYAANTCMCILYVINRVIVTL